MEYIIKNMNEDILREIITWKYDLEYAEYNLESYDELKKRKASLLDESKASNYLCYFNKSELIGYTNLVEKENGDLFLGIGLAPRHCSKGLGKELLLDTITKAKTKYSGKSIVLQVRSWNKRAITCYTNVGFKIVKKEYVNDYKGSKSEFVFMKYDI